MLFQDYKSRQDPDGPKRINLGIWDVAVCVLVMEAYKEKETGWKVGDVLKADGRCSMTHKQDELNFTEVTKTYPLKFCAQQ